MWWVLVAVFLSTVEGAISPPQALTPLNAKSSVVHPLVLKDPLTIWCSADGIKNAKFVHLSSKDKKTHPAKVTGNNATLTIDAPTVLDAGDYRCEMETKTGLKTETTSVYVRPVVHTEHVEKLETKEKEFDVETEDIIITEGESFNLTCPAFSHPLPKVKWAKNDQNIELSSRVSLSGDRLTITAVDYSDEGVYSCEAINEFTVATKTMRPLLKVSRKVSVKSQYAWVWPLAVIVATLILLVTIIWACEIRKKKREKRTATYLAPED